MVGGSQLSALLRQSALEWVWHVLMPDWNSIRSRDNLPVSSSAVAEFPSSPRQFTKQAQLEFPPSNSAIALGVKG